MTEVDHPVPLSASDVTVLNLLQSDISLSRQELAEKAGLSPSTLWRRISELEVVGAIRKRVALSESGQGRPVRGGVRLDQSGRSHE